MKNVNTFARVAEVRITSSAAEFDQLLKGGWVELGVLIIPREMASIIPELGLRNLGFWIALGRLQDEPRAPSTDELFAEPRPSEINAKLTEGWTLVGIETTITMAFSGGAFHKFASAFIVQR